MPKLPAALLAPTSRGEWSIYWARRGFAVVRLVPGGKEPLVPRSQGGQGLRDATTDEAVIRRWWEQTPDANIGGRCDGRVVLDVDVKNGGSWAAVAQWTGGSRHLSGRGDGGGHLIYTLSPAQLAEVDKVRQSKLAEGVDIRIDVRGYVVLPPSTHPETGRAYTIESDRDDVCPDALWDLLVSREASGASRRGSGRAPREAGVRSRLTELLEHPPARGAGKANDWLTAVCGHYAAQYHKADQEDLYLTHARAAAALLKPALDDAEKVIDSIWRTEQAKPERGGIEAADATNGWLVGTGSEIVCPIRVGKGDEAVVMAAGFCDFDLHARGVVLGPDARAAEWVVTLTRARDHSSHDTTIGADTLSDARKLAAWCAGWRVGIAPPERGQVGHGAAGTRILRYLESQKPDQVRLVARLGWDEQTGGFVTHEGVLTKDGPRTLDQAAVYPNPRLGKDAQFHYGFEADRDEARAVLREVLTYQDDTAASVFGAWWALCLIKGQLMQHLSLFPGMAIEAASESGKTTGFFGLMLQLAGSRNKPGMPTYAVIRDRVGAHRSGIVWMDDREDLEPYHEVLRAAPMEAAISKKGENRIDTLDFEMVAPILLTGEALGIESQKALADRYVQLALPGGIKQRKSQRPGAPPDRLQWDDVLELRERYPDGLGGLTVLSGWLVVDALRLADPVLAKLRELRHGTGRWGDTMTLLRVGARLLDLLAGTGELHSLRVDRWIGGATDPGEENSLTRLVIPAALRAHGRPDGPMFEPLGRGSVTTPAFVEKDGTVRYRPDLLADWWARERRGQIKSRTESQSALEAQADRVSVGSFGARPFRVRANPTRLILRYRAVPPELSARVLERAWRGYEGGIVTTPGLDIDISTIKIDTSKIRDEDDW